MSPSPLSAPSRPTLLVAALTILLMAAYRLAPHPWNLAPAGALFLLGGLYLGRDWRGWALPFAAMLVSDVILNLRWNGHLWYAGRLVDYAGFALVLLIGRATAGRTWSARIAGVAAAPFVFFLVSNFGVWAFGTNGYPHTAQGLAECYAAGLPFLRGTVIGDWLFAGAGILAIEGLPRLGVARNASARPA
jgi:hypothetical protein